MRVRKFSRPWFSKIINNSIPVDYSELWKVLMIFVGITMDSKPAVCIIKELSKS
jgi:hypothetical protein